MCEYPCFVSIWREEEGLQIGASGTLSSHSRAVALHKWEHEPTLRRWSAQGDYFDLAHDQTDDGEAARTLCEMRRLWPTRNQVLAALVRGWPEGEVSAGDRGMALYKAARYGHLACLKAVVASGEVSAADRGGALRNAACNGHLACERFLRDEAEVTA